MGLVIGWKNQNVVAVFFILNYPVTKRSLSLFQFPISWVFGIFFPSIEYFFKHKYMLLPLYTSMSSDFFLSFSLSFCLLYFIIFISNTISGFGSFIRFFGFGKIVYIFVVVVVVAYLVLCSCYVIFFFDEKFSNIVTQYLCVQIHKLEFWIRLFFFHFENPPCITHHYITALIIKILQFFQPTTKPSHYLCFYSMNIIYIYMFYSETSSFKSFLHSCFSWFDFFFFFFFFQTPPPFSSSKIFNESFFLFFFFFWFVVGGFIFFLFFKKDKIISTIKAESCFFSSMIMMIILILWSFISHSSHHQRQNQYCCVFFLNSFCFCCCWFLFFSSESHYTHKIYKFVTIFFLLIWIFFLSSK